MKVTKKSIFRHIVANVIIIASVAVVFVAAFSAGGAVDVSTIINGAYYHGNENSSSVALMINVYSGSDEVIQMLDILKNSQGKATFFIGGCWAEKNKSVVEAIHECGMEIGNHGYLHKDSDKLTDSRLKSEINSTKNLIEAYIGVKTTLFAPPSGAIDKRTAIVASDCGHKTIMWSKDTIDWRYGDSDLIVTRATKNLVPGDLILMHPTEATVKALPEILKKISAMGLKSAYVSEIIDENKL